jgi:hypothetical protein
MNFEIGKDEAAFAESIRAALVPYRPSEWSPGAALDDRDASLSNRLEGVGLAEAPDAGHVLSRLRESSWVGPLLRWRSSTS